MAKHRKEEITKVLDDEGNLTIHLPGEWNLTTLSHPDHDTFLVFTPQIKFIEEINFVPAESFSL